MITNQTMVWVEKYLESRLKAIINLDGRDFEMKLPSGRVLQLMFEVSTNELACAPEFHRNTSRFHPVDEQDSSDQENHPCETLANVRLKFVNQNDIDYFQATEIFQLMFQSNGVILFYNEVFGTLLQYKNDSEILRYLGEVYTQSTSLQINAHFWIEYIHFGLTHKHLNALLMRLFYNNERLADDIHGVSVFQ